MMTAGHNYIHRRAVFRGACILFLWTAGWANRCVAQEAPQPATPPVAPAPEPASAAAPRRGWTQPKAKTPEEEAAYQAISGEQNPDQRIRLVEDFLLFYPETELKESAYLAAMQAYQSKDDFEHLLTYGELVLEQNPENITVLLTLAAAISEMTDRDDADSDEKLTEGDQYALQALDRLGKLRKPPGFPEEQWTDAREDLTPEVPGIYREDREYREENTESTEAISLSSL